MKKITLFILTILCVSCTSNRVLTRMITSNYSNVIFAPKEISGTLEKIILSIEPIDAKEINNEIIEAAMRDGSYEQEYLSYKEGLFQGEKILSGTAVKKREILSRVFAAINKMVDNGNFDNEIASNFKDKLYHSFYLEEKYGWDGTEIPVQSKFSESRADRNLNPYKINDKYYSLFKLVFSNKGNDIRKIDINNFQITSGNELLYPFKNEYFESALSGEYKNEKLKYIYRMNLPNILTIIPNQKTVKYISIPAINTNNKSLTIDYIDGEKVVNYSFSVDVEKISEVFNFSAYTLSPRTSFKSIGQYIGECYVIKLSNDIFPLSGGRLYINDKNKNDLITVFGLRIDTNGNVLYSEKTWVYDKIPNKGDFSINQ